MFFVHRLNGQVDECLQYLFENNVVGPAMPTWYFTCCLEITETIVIFPIGKGSTICLNYSDEAIHKAILQFSTMLREKGDKVTAAGHDNVGLSQESYEAPSYEIDENVEDLYNFHARNSQPDDIDIPQNPNHKGKNNFSSPDDGGVGMDHWSNQDDIESIADDVIHQNNEQVQGILEHDDVMQISGFINSAMKILVSTLICWNSTLVTQDVTT